MKTPLLKVLAATSVIAVAAVITCSTAWGQTNCPLHKRAAAKNVQQASVITPVTTQTPVTPAATVIPTAPTTVSSVVEVPSTVVAPSVSQSTGTSAQLEDRVIVQEAQNSFGSGTVVPAAEKVMVKATGAHAEFTNILQKYVNAPDGQGLTHFNYGRLKATPSDKAALDNYIKKLANINPDTLGRNEAIAYYANLYNAVTVQVVTENYPVSSIKKLGPLGSGPWKKNLLTINGQPASLNNVEHDIMRKQFPSPYVHYMVNCASVGCPNLFDRAWEAGTLEQERQKAAAAYINSPRGVQITSKGLKISSIFKWFKEDFGGKSGTLQHIRKYARPELAQAIDNGAQIVDYGYDWSLNE